MGDSKRSSNNFIFSGITGAHLITAILFIGVLAFYVYTLQPSLSWGDGVRLQREVITSESFILAELVDVNFAPDPYPFARLGVAAWDHPLYVILGHVLVRALPGIDPLWLVNLISALFGAGTIALLFWICYTNTQSVFAALFAALSLAVSHTFWFHASTPEVYTLFAFLLLLGLHLYDVYERHNRPGALIASFFVMGLGVSNHLLTFLALPAAVLYLLLARRLKEGVPRTAVQWLLAVAAFLAGFLPYLIQYMRMLRTFPISQIMGPVIGSTFLSSLADTTPLLLVTSLLTYLGYLVFQFSPIGLGLGLFGLLKGRKEFAPLWHKAAAFYVFYAVFGVIYRVSDQFAFFLGSYIFWAMLVAVGVARATAPLKGLRRRWVIAGLSLSLMVMPALYMALPDLARSAGITDQSLGIPQVGVGVRDGLAFYLNPNKRGDDAAYRFGHDTMESLPPESVVIAQWYTDTDEYFVLRYFAVVKGLRPDVELVGWPREEPIDFDPAIAVNKVEAELQNGRPVYLASLSEAYYHASLLMERYCVAAGGTLYRVYPQDPNSPEAVGMACESVPTE